MKTSEEEEAGEQQALQGMSIWAMPLMRISLHLKSQVALSSSAHSEDEKNQEFICFSFHLSKSYLFFLKFVLYQ